MQLLQILYVLENCIFHIQTDISNGQFTDSLLTTIHLSTKFGSLASESNNTTTTTLDKLHKSGARFSNYCSVKFLECSGEALNKLTTKHNLNENPTYVLIFSWSSGRENIKPEMLATVQTESNYFFLNVDNNEISGNVTVQLQSICFSCQEMLVLISLSALEATTTVKEPFFLHRAQIDCPGFPFLYHFLPPPSECHKLGLQFRGEERFCTIITISNYMNFTPVDLYSMEPSALKVQSAQTSFLLSSRREMESYLFLASGQIVEPFGFLTVLAQRGFSFVSVADIARPFDLCIWLSIIISVGVLMFLMNVNEETNSDELVAARFDFNQRIFLALFGGLLEQSPALLRKTSSSKQIIRYGLGSWLLIAIVICGAYKAVFFSIMTKQLPPKSPRNFQELLNNFPHITPVAVDFTVKMGFDEIRFNSALLDVIAEYHSSIGDNAHHMQKYKFYQRLVNSTKFFVGLSYSKMRVIHELDLNVPNNFTFFEQRQVAIAKDFAFISLPAGIDHFSRIMEGRMDSEFLIPSQGFEHLLTFRTMFIVSRSYISKKFSKLFEQLAESGLTRIWKRYRKKVYSNFDLSLYACYVENPHLMFSHVFSTDPEVVSICWNYFDAETRNSVLRRKRFGGAKSESRLPMGKFLLILEMLLVGLSASCLGFVIENNIKARSRSNQW